MDGYTVVTTDGDKIGTVVGEEAGFLIVQTGTLRHHTHAIPKEFVHPVDEDEKVCVTVTKDVVMDSPKCDDGLDAQAVAVHYGLADAEPEPAETAAAAPTTREAEEQRAALREGRPGPNDVPEAHDRSRNALDPAGVDSNR
jgi:hypothetical protein